MYPSILSDKGVTATPLRVPRGNSSYGEIQLVLPLLNWLARRGRLRVGARVHQEFNWFGRRVDLVTLTASNVIVSYELKLAGLGRALEQAALNRMSFDRSYVVTGSQPRPSNVAIAREVGVGIIVIEESGVKQVAHSPLLRAERTVRQRLVKRLHDSDGHWVSRV